MGIPCGTLQLVLYVQTFTKQPRRTIPKLQLNEKVIEHLKINTNLEVCLFLENPEEKRCLLVTEILKYPYLQSRKKETQGIINEKEMLLTGNKQLLVNTTEHASKENLHELSDSDFKPKLLKKQSAQPVIEI